MPPDSIMIHGKKRVLNFTYDQLEKKVDGEKNIGELKFGSDGKLHRINNHVTFISRNKTVLTGEENYEARMVISELINRRWANDRSGTRQSLLIEASRLLLGDDVAHAPVSRDEVRMILSMLKAGTASARTMSDMVMFTRHIKKTDGANVAALLEKSGFSENDVRLFVKGWDFSPVARNRSDNFTYWAEKANRLEMDMLLAKSKDINTSDGTSMEVFMRDFTRMLVETLHDANVEVNQSGVNEPGAYKTVLRAALTEVSRLTGAGDVSTIKAKLRERMLQNVENTLLGGNRHLSCSCTMTFQATLQEMQKDVAAAVKRLWTSFSQKGNQGLAIYDVLNTCGVEKAKIQSRFIAVTIVRPDLKVEEMQVEDTTENREKFALGKEPNGAGQGQVSSVRYMARVRTEPVLPDGNAQMKELVISQDECFEMPGLGDSEDLYTVAPKAESLRREYVEHIKGKLAGAFDDIFNGTGSLSECCRKFIDERADLFTLPAINRLAEKECAAIRKRDISTLTGALKEYVNSYDDWERSDMLMSIEDLLDTYRCVEGPVEDLSVEDFSRRIAMRNEIEHLSAVLSHGSWESFDGLGFGFPPNLPKTMGLSTFHLAMRSVRTQENDIANYGRIIKLCCRQVLKDRDPDGQDAVDAIALNLLAKYRKTNRGLDADLVKRRANPNDEGEDVGLDVFGKLGQVVDDLITSKAKAAERREMLRVQNAQRNVFNEQDREARCQRVRDVIRRVLAAMGYEMKIENKDGNEVLKLEQGNRILELPED